MRPFWLGCILLLSFGILAQADGRAALSQPLQTVVDKYLYIQQQLAADSINGVPASATEMEVAMSGAKANLFGADLVEAVNRLATASDLHTARIIFQQLSKGFIAALAQNHVKTGTLHVAFCPMIKAYWVQADGQKIQNPYYGSEMLDCGEFKQAY